jgi:dihydrolipoamide dehydrogenase
LRKHGVTRCVGRGRLDGPGRVVVEAPDGAVTELEADTILLATGSVSADLPGVVPDGRRIVTSTEALAFDAVPEHLVVIGAGFIGLELGSVWLRLGAKVTVLEFLDRILPGVDLEMAGDAQALLTKQGFTFRLGCRVTGVESGPEGCLVGIEGGEPLAADRVLVAVGRRPFTDGLGLETVSLRVDERGRLPVDAHWATAVPGVYAIGDVIGGAMLAHKAEEEAVACVEQLVTGYGHVNYGVIPGICYTDPEVSYVGQNEEQLMAAGISYRKGVFPFLANGRARSLGRTDGKVKILADAATDRVLGVHIVGPRAGDLIAEAAAAMAFGASSEDLARVCHGHPTLSEAVKEAALAVDGRPLHL